MTHQPPQIIYKGRSIGIVILTAAQLLIGTIHIFFGLLFFGFEVSFLQAFLAYDVYTVFFGLVTSVFAVLIWQGKKSGWLGTMAVSIFVSVADALVLLNLPSIPGIPKFAAPTEIIYSIIVMFYLLRNNVRKKYSI
jgi:hypothetical protein